MTNMEAVKVLEDIKIYAAAEQLDALDYAIEVLTKLDKEGKKA